MKMKLGLLLFAILLLAINFELNDSKQVCRYKFAEKVENEPIHLKQADSVSKNGEKSINKLRQLGLVWICEEKNEASSSELDQHGLGDGERKKRIPRGWGIRRSSSGGRWSSRSSVRGLGSSRRRGSVSRWSSRSSVRRLGSSRRRGSVGRLSSRSSVRGSGSSRRRGSVSRWSSRSSVRRLGSSRRRGSVGRLSSRSSVRGLGSSRRRGSVSRWSSRSSVRGSGSSRRRGSVSRWRRSSRRSSSSRGSGGPSNSRNSGGPINSKAEPSLDQILKNSRVYENKEGKVNKARKKKGNKQVSVRETDESYDTIKKVFEKETGVKPKDGGLTYAKTKDGKYHLTIRDACKSSGEATMDVKNIETGDVTKYRCKG